MIKVLKDMLCLLFLVSGFVLLFILMQTKHIWGNVYIEQILVNLEENVLSSVSKEVLYGFAISAILGVVTAIAFSVILKKNRQLIIVGLICYVFSFFEVGVFSYFWRQTVSSEIYEQEYASPQNLNYTFLSNKRNLILIYVESMEENYASVANENLISNMYARMKTEVSFKGFYQLQNQDYTMAAMVGSLCGVPLRKSILKGHLRYQNFLEGMVCLPEILSQNGYKTVFMKGADIDFSRAGLFMKTHGFDEVMGKSEIQAHFGLELKEHTGAFGGFDDSTLYEVVKKKINELSSSDKPFFLSFLTLDTHTPDYFLSPVCKSEHGDKKDVIRCADQMLSEFLSWLEKQDFYLNTTVFVMGDHIQTGKNELYEDQRGRRVVNFVLNPSPLVKKQEHTAWTTLDAAPTILSALGVRFSDGKFGLGRSLFSKTPTLVEKMGLKLETELSKSSKVYDSFESVRVHAEPKYEIYAPLGVELISNKEIEKYATFSNVLMGVVYSDEFSFMLPTIENKDIELDLSFKVMMDEGGAKTISVVANGQEIEKWNVTMKDKQPLMKQIRIPLSLIDNGKLLLKFETNDDALSETFGIGVMSLKISGLNEGLF